MEEVRCVGKEETVGVVVEFPHLAVDGIEQTHLVDVAEDECDCVDDLTVSAHEVFRLTEQAAELVVVFCHYTILGKRQVSVDAFAGIGIRVGIILVMKVLEVSVRTSCFLCEIVCRVAPEPVAKVEEPADDVLNLSFLFLADVLEFCLIGTEELTVCEDFRQFLLLVEEYFVEDVLAEILDVLVYLPVAAVFDFLLYELAYRGIERIGLCRYGALREPACEIRPSGKGCMVVEGCMPPLFPGIQQTTVPSGKSCTSAQTGRPEEVPSPNGQLYSSRYYKITII